MPNSTTEAWRTGSARGKIRDVFDAHTHAVSPDVERFPRHSPDFPASWLAHDPPAAADLVGALGAHGVDGAVLVQPQGAYGHDNRYVIEAAARTPVLTPVVSVDATRPDAAARVHALADEGAVGVRLFSIPTPERAWLADPISHPVWAACADRALVVSVCCFATELPAVAAVAARFDGVAVLVDHCGFVDLAGPAAELDPLAGLANVYPKVTGHLLHQLDDPDAAVAALARRFGEHRLVWGSDWPQTELGYGESVELARRAAASLRAPDGFLGDTARALYG